MAKESPKNLLTVVAKSVGSAIGTIANRVRVTRDGTTEVETVAAPGPKVPRGKVSKSRGKRPGSVAKKRPSKSASQKKIT
jgi:hypothetical protein